MYLVREEEKKADIQRATMTTFEDWALSYVLTEPDEESVLREIAKKAATGVPFLPLSSLPSLSLSPLVAP